MMHLLAVRDGLLMKSEGGGGAKPKKKIIPSKKLEKKIFPGIVPKKNCFLGRNRAAKSHGVPKKENKPRDLLFK
jgi:hypothetical protein